MFGFSLLVVSQQMEPNTVDFDYDDAGNRILKHAIYVPVISSAEFQSDSIQDKEFPIKSTITDSASINDHMINIFPNPTLGRFRVNISSLSGSDNVSYVLISLTGRVIDKKLITARDTEINLEDMKNGPYVFKLTMNGTVKSWIIIKR